MSNTDKLHPLYTEVSGTGALDITVRVLAHDRLYDWRTDRAPLLAKITGGEFSSEGPDPLSPWKVGARDDETTDFEHDSARFIDLGVVNPALMSNYNDSHYVGVLTSARLWPTGVDPATSGDGDSDACICDGWPGKPGEHTPHRIAAYLPPVREEVDALLPCFVVVTTRPNLDHVQKAAQFYADQEAAEANR